MMTTLFRIILLVGVFCYLLLIIWLMKKGRLSLKYTLVWFFSGIVMLVCVVFPGLVGTVTKLIGVYSEVNAVFFVGVCFLLLIILFLTSVASGLSERVRTLTQTQAMLEQRIRALEDFVQKDNNERNNAENKQL